MCSLNASTTKMKFKELQSTLGRLIVERAQLELGTTRTINGKKVRRVASDNLRRGLSYSVNGKKVNFNTNQAYGGFIHYGVNGTKKTWGSPFSYGSKQPPIEPILKWMRIKGIKVRKTGGSFAKQTPKAVRGLAFGIAKKIKENGIAPLPYYNLAIGNVFRTQKALIAAAVKKDIELLLNFD